MPPRMLSAPLRLTAMTLRGLGPYLHGARLEIKPLTILCGENGSGKSTWIETLRALKSTARNPLFPLAPLKYSKGDVDRYGINNTITNLWFGMRKAGEVQADVAKLVRADDNDQFGPLGCIGLELEATTKCSIRGCDVSGTDINWQNDAQCFLFRGQIPAGSKLSLRWVKPPQMDGFELCVELRFGSERIRLRRSFERTADSWWRHNQYIEEDMTFECTGAFLGLSLSDNRLIELGHVKETSGTGEAEITDKWEVVSISESLHTQFPDLTLDGIRRILFCFLKLFRGLVQEALRGFFPIGPIRKLLTKNSADATPPDQRKDRDGYEDMEEEAQKVSEQARKEAVTKIRPELRYVGHNGGKTQDLHAYWAYNLMRQSTSPYTGGIPSEFTVDEFTHFGEPSSAADVLASALSQEFRQHILQIVDQVIRTSWESGCNSSLRDQFAIDVLNDALRSRNLFAPREFRPDISSDAHREARLMFGSTPEEQDERLASRQLLSDGDVRRVNRLLFEAIIDKEADNWIEDSFKEGFREPQYPKRKCWHRTGYLLETFVSYWMNRLTGTKIKYMKFDDEPIDESWTITATGTGELVPNGGLVDRTHCWHKRGILADRTPGREPTQDGTSYDLSNTIQNPVLRRESDWSLMSTGFHQLAPIVVQAGLLHQHEVMAVENPEAHLHPSLQIKVAEFLLHQANAGKVMLVETHSDLIVRRILRAIREEQVSPGNVFKQSSVGINFTSLDDREKYAEIEKLEVNEKGQVHNWPPGFMDDDLKEADRWLQSNFGSDDSGEDTDE